MPGLSFFPLFASYFSTPPRGFVPVLLRVPFSQPFSLPPFTRNSLSVPVRRRVSSFLSAPRSAPFTNGSVSVRMGATRRRTLFLPPTRSRSRPLSVSFLRFSVPVAPFHTATDVRLLWRPCSGRQPSPPPRAPFDRGRCLKLESRRAESAEFGELSRIPSFDPMKILRNRDQRHAQEMERKEKRPSWWLNGRTSTAVRECANTPEFLLLEGLCYGETTSL